MLPRANLIELLHSHRPADAIEEEMLERMLAFALSEPLCMDATFAAGHVTASAWLLGQGPAPPSKVLLTHHRKLGRWFQPGGHLEPGETVLAAALREAREESGLESGVEALSEAIFDVDIHLIPERGAARAHYHYDVRFLLEAPAEAPLIASAESHALAWVALAETHRYNSSESILRMVRKTPGYGSTSG